LTLELSRPVDFRVLEARAMSLEFVVAWFLFVLFWLPLAAAALLGEIGSWRAARRAWGRLRYWLGTLASFVVGHFALLLLGGWLFERQRFTGQLAKNLAGLALGYAIALGSWLVILALAEEAISAPEPRAVDETWD
jgi:membrane protease YdiL (CAAX protease family)